MFAHLLNQGKRLERWAPPIKGLLWEGTCVTPTPVSLVKASHVASQISSKQGYTVLLDAREQRGTRHWWQVGTSAKGGDNLQSLLPLFCANKRKYPSKKLLQLVSRFKPPFIQAIMAKHLLAPTIKTTINIYTVPYNLHYIVTHISSIR